MACIEDEDEEEEDDDKTEEGREGINIVTLERKEKSINQSINQSFL